MSYLFNVDKYLPPFINLSVYIKSIFSQYIKKNPDEAHVFLVLLLRFHYFPLDFLTNISV